MTTSTAAVREKREPRIVTRKIEPLWITIQNMSRTKQDEFYRQWEGIARYVAEEYKSAFSTSNDVTRECDVLEFLVRSEILAHIAHAMVAGYPMPQIQREVRRTIRRILKVR